MNTKTSYYYAVFDNTMKLYLALYRVTHGRSYEDSPRYSWTAEFDYRQLFRTEKQARKALHQATGNRRTGVSRANEFLLQEIALVPTSVTTIGGLRC